MAEAAAKPVDTGIDLFLAPIGWSAGRALPITFDPGNAAPVVFLEKGFERGPTTIAAHNVFMARLPEKFSPGDLKAVIDQVLGSGKIMKSSPQSVGDAPSARWRPDTVASALSEDILPENQALYCQFFENNPAIQLLIDPETGVIVAANAAAREFYGYTVEEVSGLTLSDLDMAPTADVQQHLLKTAVEGHLHYEATHRTRDNEMHDVVVYAGACKQQDRVLVYSIVHDVTERVLVESALKTGTSRLRALYKGFPIPTFIWQKSGRDFTLVDFNDAANDMSKGRIAPHVGTRASDYFRDAPDLLELLDKCYAEKHTVLRDLMKRLPAGADERRFHVTFTFAPPDLILTHLEDITERTLAEKELRQSEERFRTIADFTYDWEYWRGPDRKFLWVSPSCERITGYKPQDFYDDPGLFYRIIHADDRPVVETFLERDTEKSKYYHLDFRIVRKDGEIRWVSHNGQPVYSAVGAWQGRRASNRDVTGRKEAEDQLLDYQKELRTLTSELSLAEERERRSIAVDLHDRVGHTLAMSQIKLNQLQLNHPHLSDTLEEIVQLVESAISDTRTLTLEISPPSLYELGLEAALDEFGHEMQDQHGIRTEVEDDGLPKPLGDDTKIALYRTAREVMINVIKHARASMMRVSLRREGEKILVNIIDDGVGFDMSVSKQNALKNKSFGLFSIRERIGHMGGEVKIQSRVGQGTSVTLRVPLDKDI